MPRAILDGNRIDHRHALNVVNVQAYEVDQFQIFAGDDTEVWDLGAPTTDHAWVLAWITISFDILPTLPGLLFVDSDTGGNLWWFSFIGQIPAAVEPGSPATFHFIFDPAIRFTINEDLAVNWIGGDGATLGFISYGVWEEDDICY